MESIIRGIGARAVPGDDQAYVIQQQTELVPDNPKVDNAVDLIQDNMNGMFVERDNPLEFDTASSYTP